MRDRETDSWWSIMTSDAIGGELEGADLVELPAGEKTTWKSWRERYPDTLVLSVGGEEHVDNNPYDNYFTSDGTFHELEIDDRRLAPKDPVYTFWLGGKPWAVDQRAFEGGAVFEIEGLEDRQVLLFRHKESPIYESTRAYLVANELVSRHELEELLRLAESEDNDGIETLPGFDTFWYTWVATNTDTQLVR